jgi:hypothetical protein
LCALPLTSKSEFLTGNIPFLDYAVHGVLYHSNAAEAEGAPQTAFLQTFSSAFNAFKEAHNAVEPYRSRPYKPNVTLLYVLAEKNLDYLIRLELLRTPFDWEEVGRYHSPMGAAVRAGNIAAIQGLLGCQINGEGSSGDTLLEPEVVSRMANHLVSFRKRSRLRSDYSMASFLLAYTIEGNHMTILQLLLRTGEISPNKVLNNGYTPLSFAIECGKAEILEALLRSFGFAVETGRASYALSLAISKDKKDCANILLDHPLDFSGQDDDGESVIHWAARENDEVILRRLIALGYDVSHRDKLGRDPLSHAAEAGKIEMVWTLIGTGVVYIDGKDTEGRTPFSWAAGPDRPSSEVRSSINRNQMNIVLMSCLLCSAR